VIRRALALAFAAVGVGCGPDVDRDADRSLRDAIERLRGDTGASPEQRRMLLATVGALPAHGAAAQEAKSACIPAYTSLATAEEEIASAELQMKAALAVEAPARAAATEVASAEQHLAAAKQAMPACDAAAVRLAIAVR
jgi:hypothetical protein